MNISKDVLDLLSAGSTASAPSISVSMAAGPFSAPAARVQLSGSVKASANAIRAFIATDSDNPAAFIQLAETAGLPTPATVYCGVRNFGSRNGLMISIFTQANIPDSVIVILTVMQQGAQTYASPVLYTGM
jgi:hypothetical protein